MSIIYFPITTLDQDADGSPVTVWADANGFSIQDAEDPEYYPTPYKEATEGFVVDFSVDGQVEGVIFAGAHPPRRPK